MLDFLVIGAQKAGSTALHWALARSEKFQGPKGKELPVFHREAPAPIVERELIRLFNLDRTHVRRTPPYLGKVTPHYLTSRAAPTNIAAVAPEAALIAVLRDPWERAFSHYRMAVGRGLERRSFLAAITAEARTLRAHALRLPEFGGYADTNYLAGSLYGGLLARYSEAGLRERITILDYRTMRTDWGDFAAAFCRAVDPAADPQALPPPPLRNVTDNGTKLNDVATRLATVPAVRHAAQVIPRRFRHALWWQLNEVVTRPYTAPLKPPPLSDASDLVLELLEDDAERLQRLQLRGTDGLFGQVPGTPG